MAIDALLAEINSDPDQTDDLIKVYPSDVDDLNDLKDSLIYYRTYFDGPKQLEVIWETGGYYDTSGGAQPYDTFSVIVDIAKFFDDPMNNPKMYLPEYTITLDSFTVSYPYGDELHVEACYSWAADNYADWTWPDATFNGLLPQWTSDSIKTRLDLDPGEWIKADCDTLDFGGGGW